MSSTPVDATGVSGGWVTDTLCSEEATVSQTPESSKVLVGAQRGRCAGSIGGAFFGLAQFQVSLTSVGSLDGIHASAETGLLEKVSPAFVGIGRALPVLVFAHDGLGILPALDDFDYAGGYIGADVVTDEYVGRFRVVDGQRDSPFEGSKWGDVKQGARPQFALPNGHTMRSRVSALERADVLSLPAFRALGDVEFDTLAFLEALEAACLDRREVHENIFASLPADKAVALSVVKPLYCSLFCHLVLVFLSINLRWKGFGNNEGRC